MEAFHLDKKPITIDDLVAVARLNRPVAISSEGEDRVTKASEMIARWVKEKRVIYGITTGFGALCDVTISQKNIHKLQENILMSHAAGIGNALSEEIVRTILAIRVHDLSLGYSGCRVETVRYLIELLNQGVSPVIPEKA